MNDKLELKILEEFNKAVEEYLKVFGDDSLDNVIELPHPITSSLENYEDSTKELYQRIENNKPFDNTPTEIDFIY
ncbi:MAG: hypothetical protein Q3988_05640 [Gemella sp.]|nr:hypothetical protein [Gemella sp.]